MRTREIQARVTKALGFSRGSQYEYVDPIPEPGGNIRRCLLTVEGCKDFGHPDYDDGCRIEVIGDSVKDCWINVAKLLRVKL